jgi:hypothetical protein
MANFKNYLKTLEDTRKKGEDSLKDETAAEGLKAELQVDISRANADVVATQNDIRLREQNLLACLYTRTPDLSRYDEIRGNLEILQTKLEARIAFMENRKKMLAEMFPEKK